MENASAEIISLPPAFGLVAIAASWGGIDAIRGIVSALPVSFPVPIVFLLHVGDEFSAHLPQTIGRDAKISVKWAEHGEQAKPGYVYVAPPGAHLLVDATGRFILSRTPRVHYSRPSATILLGSSAFSFKERLLAAVLTGYGSDGAVGVNIVRSMGGKVIVQDERSSIATDMPKAAVQIGGADLILPLAKIPAALIALTMVPGAATLLTGAGPVFA